MKQFVAFVYVISAGDFIKIGVARDVSKRVHQMRVGCPFEIEVLRAWPCSDPYAFERRLHHQLRAYRVRGEWFRVNQGGIEKLLTMRPPYQWIASEPLT